MIPRVFHRIWLDEPVPEKFEEFWAKLRELHPRGWEFRTWADSGELGWIKNREMFDAATLEAEGVSSYATRSDVLRYEILAKYGGVYLDADVEPLRAFDELMADPRPFIAWEDDWELDPAVIASPPGHPAAVALVESVASFEGPPGNKGGPPSLTGPGFVTAQWRHRPDVRRLRPISFFPVHYKEMELLGGPYPAESFAVHHWNAGWKPAERRAADDAAWRAKAAREREKVTGRALTEQRRQKLREAREARVTSRAKPAAARVPPAPVAPDRVSILVPFRAETGSDHRLVAWSWLRERWALKFPEAEIVVGADSGGVPFSKTTAVNDAFLRSTRDILVIADADCWMDTGALLAAGGEAAETGRLVVPWRKVVRLTEADSNLMTDGPPDADFDLSPEVRRRAFSSPGQRTAATLVVIRRESFELVCGMDPRFRGWGHEDVCFAVACARVLGNARLLRTGHDVVTLYHPRPSRGGRVWEGESASSANRALNSVYRSAINRAQMLELCAQHPLGGEAAPIAPVHRAKKARERIQI